MRAIKGPQIPEKFVAGEASVNQAYVSGSIERKAVDGATRGTCLG